MGSGNGPKSYPIFGATREFQAKIGARREGGASPKLAPLRDCRYSGCDSYLSGASLKSGGS